MPPFDEDTLTSGPDISTFDRTKVDFGNEVEVAENDEVAEKAAEKVAEKEETSTEAAEKEETSTEAAEKEKETEETEEEEQSRDAKGRFEPKIPKSRFDEAVGKEREAREAAERRAQELEAQLRERAQTSDAVAGQRAKLEELESEATKLEEKHAQLLLDGEVKEAAAVMKQIRHTERQIARFESTVDTQALIERASAGERWALTVARLESEFPQVNPDSPQYDDLLTNFVRAEQERLAVSERLAPHVALDKAVRAVMGRFGQKQDEAPAKDEKGLQREAVAQDRKQQQVAKNISTAKAQPASMKDSGMDSDKMGEKAVPSAGQMTLEEYSALPESVKARMRGDTL